MKERTLSSQAIKNWRQGRPGNVSTYTEGLQLLQSLDPTREVCGNGLGTLVHIQKDWERGCQLLQSSDLTRVVWE